MHTVIVYTLPGGWGAATWLRLQLEGNASSLFDVATFGAVYVRAVSAPYMVSWPAWCQQCVPALVVCAVAQVADAR